MENKFKDNGLNIASNKREPSAEEILIEITSQGQAMDAEALAKSTGYAKNTVIKWLNILKREGLVIPRKLGKTNFFSLRGKNK